MMIIAAENFVQQAAGPLVLAEYHRWTSRKSSTAPFNCSLSGAGPAESMSVMRKLGWSMPPSGNGNGNGNGNGTRDE
ncbi:hypothetical protein HYFRA_00000989 [Hymenoscyphus fraxineus]|uniref:Uncharacterized protein n=1 Tax=Hymenoscyphus fraxineus TaxID=746836 RepID=A0A9N9PGV1_9HELO|nr:hypothetical protein HYFRA_00000989 [Hymenoscyphus fraxineus]